MSPRNLMLWLPADMSAVVPLGSNCTSVFSLVNDVDCPSTNSSLFLVICLIVPAVIEMVPPPPVPACRLIPPSPTRFSSPVASMTTWVPWMRLSP